MGKLFSVMLLTALCLLSTQAQAMFVAIDTEPAYYSWMLGSENHPYAQEETSGVLHGIVDGLNTSMDAQFVNTSTANDYVDDNGGFWRIFVATSSTQTIHVSWDGQIGLAGPTGGGDYGLNAAFYYDVHEYDGTYDEFLFFDGGTFFTASATRDSQGPVTLNNQTELVLNFAPGTIFGLYCTLSVDYMRNGSFVGDITVNLNIDDARIFQVDGAVMATGPGISATIDMSYNGNNDSVEGETWYEYDMTLTNTGTIPIFALVMYAHYDDANGYHMWNLDDTNNSDNWQGWTYASWDEYRPGGLPPAWYRLSGGPQPYVDAMGDVPNDGGFLNGLSLWWNDAHDSAAHTTPDPLPGGSSRSDMYVRISEYSETGPTPAYLTYMVAGYDTATGKVVTYVGEINPPGPPPQFTPPQLVITGTASDTVTLRWNSESSHQYRLFYYPDMTTAGTGWTAATGWQTGTDGLMTQDQSIIGAGKRFYTVEYRLKP